MCDVAELEINLVTKVRISWYSRHPLLKPERVMLTGLYGDFDCQQRNVTFLSVNHCLSELRQANDRGELIYISPLPHDMDIAVRESGIPYHFFQGDRSKAVFQPKFIYQKTATSQKPVLLWPIQFPSAI